MQTPSHVPVCPNHGCPLDGIGFPIPQKGTGICPISGCPFDFEVEVDQETIVQDKFGNTSKQLNWNVSGDETKGKK